MIVRGTSSLILAPMEGVTDAPMRAFFTEQGGFSFCVSEFLRISQEVPPARTFLEHVPELNKGGGRTPSGVSVQIQLLGGNPERLARSAQVACELGALGIDLNFGCPSPTVNHHDGGATLLKYPDRIRAIVREVRAAVPAHLPVSAKLRLGWDDPEAIHLNSERAAEGGASWITIHGRTRLQGYQPPAFWKPIGKVRKNLGIPVIANGEIWTLDDFRKCRDETGCEHFMLGRGALADPFLPLQIAQELGVKSPLEGSEVFRQVNWSDLLQRFTEISREYTSRKGYLPSRMKQWLQMAHRRVPLPWFDQVKRLSDADEMLRTITLVSSEKGSC